MTAYPAEAIVRFWRRIDKTETCWLWHGLFDLDGYGVIGPCIKGMNPVTRAIYIAISIDGKAVPAGHTVRHKCGNRRCVRPSHLRVELRTDDEALAKLIVGTRPANPVITPILATLDLEAVAEAYEAGKSTKQIAAEYGVSRSTIRRALDVARPKPIESPRE